MGLIGALIGWVTNVIAIRLLFRPYQPIVIPGVKYSLQGLIPKRQKEIAAAIGRIVSDELLTGQDIAESLAREDIREKILDKVKPLVQERVMAKLPALIPLSLQATIAELLSRLLTQEIGRFLEHPEEVFGEAELENIRAEISNIVENKIISFEMMKLEELIQRVARTELRTIELLGGALGFLIGLVQGLLSLKILL
jgi:uncharacterized membrane protein YheB (UPF0754 family)